MGKPGPHTLVDVLTGKAELGVIKHFTKKKETPLEQQLTQYGIDPKIAKQYAKAAQNIKDTAARKTFSDSAVAQALQAYTTNLPSLTGEDTTPSLAGQINDYINQTLGPEQQPINVLGLQSVLGQLYQPLMNQENQSANLVANSLRASGQPQLADQYTGLAGHVANAYAQQAMAFPAAYQLTQALDRGAKAQELRNQLGQSAFGSIASLGTGASGLASQISQLAQGGTSSLNSQETVGGP